MSAPHGRQMVRWPREGPRLRGFGVALLVAGLLLWLAFHDGGFFPTTWNIAALVLLWLAVVVLLVGRDVALGRLDLILIAGLGASAGWTLLSAFWSLAPANSVLEGERALLYLSGSVAVLMVASRHGPRPIAAAVLAAATVVCGDALVHRLVAVDPLPYNRLGGPVGYWNTLGLLAAVGLCLALTAVAHERRPITRATAASSVPILLAALYLTFSRGSWLALTLGLAVAFGIDPRRRELVGAALSLALPCAAVLALATEAHALTTPTALRGAVSADAHRLALVVVFACVASALLARVVPRLSARLPAVRLRRLAPMAFVCATGITVLLAGGPGHLSGAAVRAFDSPPPNSAQDLTTHVVSLSGSMRGDLWRVALHAFASRPLAGNGAGTYARLWLMERPNGYTMQDAHSLYLETLTELGAIGLVLLIGALAVPLVAARHAARRPYVPALIAAYAAFLVHAAIDWDWEMPVVTMAGLVCGAGAVAAARRDPRQLRRGARLVGLAAAIGLCGCTIIFLVGNRALDSAGAAAARGDHSLQARARDAQRWAPWSPDPSRWLATVQLDSGNRRAARRLLHNAIARDGTDWSLWMEMAAASAGRARTLAFNRAVRLNPRGPELVATALRYGLLPSAAAHKAP